MVVTYSGIPRYVQAKVDTSQKWMEAIKSMEALASFSRRKIRNWVSLRD